MIICDQEILAYFCSQRNALIQGPWDSTENMLILIYMLHLLIAIHKRIGKRLIFEGLKASIPLPAGVWWEA